MEIILKRKIFLHEKTIRLRRAKTNMRVNEVLSFGCSMIHDVIIYTGQNPKALTG